MKKIIQMAVLLLATAIISCNGGSGNRKTETASETTPVEKTEPQKPAPVPEAMIITPEKVFVGEYINTKDTSEGEGGKFLERVSKFTFILTMPGGETAKGIDIGAVEYWDPANGEKEEHDYGKKTKDLFDEIKKLKPADFTIIMVNGAITRVAILAVFKEGTDGKVGELVSSEREIYPDVFFKQGY